MLAGRASLGVGYRRAFLVPVVLGLLSHDLTGATLVVDADGGFGVYRVIQEALDAAADGDTVLVRSGTYRISAPLDFNRRYDPGNPLGPRLKNLTLESVSGTESTIVRMTTPAKAGQASVIVFESGETDSVVEGFTLTGGRGTKWGTGLFQDGGGAVLCRNRSRPIVRDCILEGNEAVSGGGVLCDGAGIDLRACDIRANRAEKGGGVCSRSSNSALVNCAIRGNTALSGGGVYASEPGLSLVSCTVALNAAADGGGVLLVDAPLSALNCIFGVNAGRSLVSSPPDQPSGDVSYSCIDGYWDGSCLNCQQGDPRFCGWPSSAAVHVDAASAGPGDGSSANPFPDLSAAISSTLFDLSLSPDSPCIGSGKDGATMGVTSTVCGRPRVPARTVLLAAGSYGTEDCAFAGHVSVAGVGEPTLVGGLFGLRTGASIDGVAVTGGELGGLILGSGDGPMVSRCHVTDNSGPGILAYRSDAAIEDSMIVGNGEDGIESTHSDLAVTGCALTGNAGAGISAAGYCDDSCSGDAPAVVACDITGNGLGVSCTTGVSPSFRDCRILGNREGGVRLGSQGNVVDAKEPSLTNCLIAANGGAGLECTDINWSPELVNSTVAGNLAEGVKTVFRDSVNLINCIVSHNGSGILVGDECEVTATYSCIRPGAVWPGTGNIQGDPRFMDLGVWDDRGTPLDRTDDVWTGGDFRLRATSPCIDAGTSIGSPLPPTADITGAMRWDDPATPNTGGGHRRFYDMGAYEYRPFAGKGGDATGDGNVDISDAVFILNFLFLGGRVPSCRKTADANDDGSEDISDAVYILTFLFLGGPAPIDPTEC